MNAEPAPSALPRPLGAQPRWSAQVAAALLAGQGCFLLLGVLFLLVQINWQNELANVTLSVAAIRSSAAALLMLPFGVTLLVLALLVFLRPRLAWVLAMILQCLILFISLQVYFVDGSEYLIFPWLLHLIMFGAILIVIFFSAPEGRTLLARPLGREGGAHGA